MRVLRLALLLVAGLLAVTIVALAGFRGRAALHETQPRAQAAPQGGRFVKAADIEAYVRETGPASGEPVLLVHGFGAWSGTWRDTIAPLAAAGYRVIAIDLPPFGFSERPAQREYRTPEQARRILGVLDALQVRQAVFVGHSFGGRPTMEAAFLEPGRVRALVLVCAALGLDAPPSREESGVVSAALGVRPLRNTLLAATGMNPLLSRTLLGSFVAEPSRLTDERIAIYQRPTVVEGSTDALGDWVMANFVSPRPSRAGDPGAYGALRVPALVVWGERDTVTPLPQGEGIAKRIPGSKLVVLPGIGHIPQIEDVAAFNRELLGFLAGL